MTSDGDYKGKVKKCLIKKKTEDSTISTYRLYDRYGLLIEYSDEYNSVTRLKYNDKKKCVLEESLLGGDIPSKTHYQYNDKNQHIRTICYIDTELLWEERNTFDSKGNLISKIIYDYNGNERRVREQVEYEYDSANKMISELKDGYWLKTFFYYNNGLLKRIYLFENEEKYGESVYYYDDNGNLEVIYDKIRGNESRRFHKYDKYNNCVSEQLLTNNVNCFYERIFDFVGNCIGEKFYYYGREDDAEITTTQIEYYD